MTGIVQHRCTTGVVHAHLQVAEYPFINTPLIGTTRQNHALEREKDAQNSYETYARQLHHYHCDVVQFLDVTITSVDLCQKLSKLSQG